jgi:hypothetical protein
LAIQNPLKIAPNASKVVAMKTAFVPLYLFVIGFFPLQTCIGQTHISVNSSGTPETETVTIDIKEPATIKLKQLFKMADIVAVVRIVSGDTENYKTAIYKAVVVKSFKGTADGKTLYFGPFIGDRLGWEYVVFLRGVKEPAVPTTITTAAYGVVNYFEVFNQGYSSMQSSYECVFDGKETNQECDDGVQVCTDYVVLPKNTPVFPSLDEVVPFGCRWVRKSKFLSLLTDLTH